MGRLDENLGLVLAGGSSRKRSLQAVAVANGVLVIGPLEARNIRRLIGLEVKREREFCLCVDPVGRRARHITELLQEIDDLDDHGAIGR